MKYTMTRNKSSIVLDTVTGKITGNTYNMKDVIKDNFSGAMWDKSAKAWVVSDMEEQIDKIRNYLVRCYQLEEIKPAEPTASPINVIHNRFAGLCPRCHTYCHGDCVAAL